MFCTNFVTSIDAYGNKILRMVLIKLVMITVIMKVNEQFNCFHHICTRHFLVEVEENLRSKTEKSGGCLGCKAGIEGLVQEISTVPVITERNLSICDKKNSKNLILTYLN